MKATISTSPNCTAAEIAGYAADLARDLARDLDLVDEHFSGAEFAPPIGAYLEHLAYAFSMVERASFALKHVERMTESEGADESPPAPDQT